jgi:hypothetical protein
MIHIISYVNFMLERKYGVGPRPTPPTIDKTIAAAEIKETNQ